jgi:hypothetical protein
MKLAFTLRVEKRLALTAFLDAELQSGVYSEAIGRSGGSFSREDRSKAVSSTMRIIVVTRSFEETCLRGLRAADVITSSGVAGFYTVPYRADSVRLSSSPLSTEIGLSHPGLYIHILSLPLLLTLSVPQPQFVHTYTLSYTASTRSSSIHPT